MQAKLEMWITSFKRVNLYSTFRMDFKEWTENISGFLDAGSIYKMSNSQALPFEKFSLLPSIWWGMNPKDRHSYPFFWRICKGFP